MHRTRNAAYGQPYREFESPPLRHSCSKPSIHLKSRLHIGFMPPEWHTRVVHVILATARPWKHPKTGVYWFRRRVPTRLLAAVGKREEKRSFGNLLHAPLHI